MGNEALSRNSTKCPIGAGFSVSGCELRLAVLRLRPVGGELPRGPMESESPFRPEEALSLIRASR
jgi:hypothetical protein